MLEVPMLDMPTDDIPMRTPTKEAQTDMKSWPTRGCWGLMTVEEQQNYLQKAARGGNFKSTKIHRTITFQWIAFA